MTDRADDGWHYDPANAPTGDYLITDRMGRVSLGRRGPDGAWVHMETNALLTSHGAPIAFQPLPPPARVQSP